MALIETILTFNVSLKVANFNNSQIYICVFYIWGWGGYAIMHTEYTSMLKMHSKIKAVGGRGGIDAGECSLKGIR